MPYSPPMVRGLDRCHAAVMALIESPEPAFLSRLGGSDSDAVIAYSDLTSRSDHGAAFQLAQQKLDLLRRFNGYYDKAEDPSNIGRYCELLSQDYRRCDHLMMAGSPLLTEFFPEEINPIFQVDTTDIRRSLHRFVEDIRLSRPSVSFYPYPYVERILHGDHTLFKAFAKTLPGKRVLAVTPFAESIRINFPQRRRFFSDYTYPDFCLLTYNTPITYSGLPACFYPDTDWFETLARMKREISKLDFDIALLACGSYAVPLGLHIRDIMQRKAIYVGGCLQLYFGVMGRRYDDPFFRDQINVEAFIHPIERERFLPYVTIDSGTSHEAFGAYF